MRLPEEDIIHRSLKLLALILTISGHAETIQDEIIVTPSDESQDSPSSSPTQSRTLNKDQFPKGNTSLSDILNFMPGTFSSQGVYSKDPSQVMIRGFAGSQVIVLKNGLPIASSLEPSINPDSIPLTDVRRVRVTPGAWNLSGSLPSMGGTIELETDTSKDDNELGVMAGSFETFELSARLQKRKGSHRFGLSGSFFDTSGAFAVPNPKSDPLSDLNVPPTTQMTNENRRKSNALFSYAHQSSHSKQRALVEWNQSTQGIPGTIDRPFEAIQESEKALAAEFHISDIHLRPSSNLSASALLRGRRYGMNDPLGEVSGIPESETLQAYQGTLIVRPEWRLSDNLQLQNAISYQAEKSKQSQISELRHHGILNTNLSIYFWNDRITISPTLTLWKVTAYPVKVFPGISTQVDITPTVSLIGKFSISQRLPTFQELHMDQGFIVGNSGLKPETSLGGDLGVMWKPHPSTSLQLSYFEYRIQDLIEYSLASGFRYKPFNFTRAESRGLEFQWTARPLSWFKTQNVFTYQYVVNSTSQTDSSWKRIPNRPLLFGRSGGIFSYKDKVSYSQTFLYGLDRFTNRSNTDSLPDRYSWDHSIDWKIRKDLTVTIEMKNSLNRINFDQFRFPTQGRSFYGKVSAVF